jgi:acetyl esterase/lipase
LRRREALGVNHRKKLKDELIIHIHGGGFVSMSSGSH